MGVTGRSLPSEDTLAASVRLDWDGCEDCDDSSGKSDCEVGAEEVGASSLTIACSMAGRTLKFFNCLFKSDLAAFGAVLDIG